METLETGEVLEDKEHKRAVLADRLWLQVSDFKNNMNNAMTDLNDNISRLKVLVSKSNNNNTNANYPNNNNYNNQYPLPNNPPRSSYSNGR